MITNLTTFAGYVYRVESVSLDRAAFRILLKGGCKIQFLHTRGGEQALYITIYILYSKISRGAQNPQRGGGANAPPPKKKQTLLELR